MDDDQFDAIIRSYEIRKKVDRFIESEIIEKNIKDIKKFIRETDLEMFIRLYNLKHNSKFKRYEFKETVYNN